MNKTYIHHSTRNHGAAAITAILFFVIISGVFVLGLSSPVVRDYTTARDVGSSKGAYYLSEAGLEDVMYRYKKGIPVTSPVILSLGGETATTIITDVSATEKTISSIGSVSSNTRHTSSVLSKMTGVSFFYGMQVGNGGLNLYDDAVIIGNVYSNGDVDGDSDTWDTDYIYGNLIVAGSHNIYDTSISGSFYGDDIDDSYIGGDAYYHEIDDSTTVVGTKFPGTPHQPSTTFAITQEMIDEWKASAEAGGITYCTSENYNITGSVTLGPRKFIRSGGGSCTLNIESGDTLTLTGPIWVKGDIVVGGNGRVRISPEIEGQSVAMIADNPEHHWSGDQIRVDDNATFVGAGDNSYITLISMGNGDSENPAIELWDDVTGDVIVFAPSGYVKVRGRVHVKEISGYRVRVEDDTVLEYETGVASLLFNSGPMGSWETRDWKLGQ